VQNDIENICKILKINETIIKLPYAYDTIYDEKINFSGGEKQRILLARELLKEAKILIFDEPTSSLDEENERILCEILKELKENRIIIIVSHRKKY
jgi:ABC-type bacteriocin/lantibiotic exporter with double-glycine peptidase domain